MKALNKQERNSAILRFSLWLFISVIIICVPVILTAFISREQHNIESNEKDILVKDATFERDYISTKVQEITDLMDRRDAGEIDAEVFNAELMHIFSDITAKSEADTSWRGDMYRNIVHISKFLITADKIVSSSGENKDKQITELDKILLELESCNADLADLNSEKKKKDMSKGLNDVDKQMQKIIKMLESYKSGL